MAISPPHKPEPPPPAPAHEFYAGDQVAVDAEVHSRVVRFRGAVTRVGPGALLVLPSTEDSFIGQLERGQPLHLTFGRRRGALVAASSFLGYVDEGECRLVAVERPIGAQAVQRREHLRLDIERRVLISSINGEELRRDVVVQTINVSAGGLLVAAALPLCVGDKLVLALELTPGDVVNADGQVIRIVEPQPGADPSDPASGYRVAIRFLDLRLGWEDRIVRHLFSVQRRQREIALKQAALAAALKGG